MLYTSFILYIMCAPSIARTTPIGIRTPIPGSTKRRRIVTAIMGKIEIFQCFTKYEAASEPKIVYVTCWKAGAKVSLDIRVEKLGLRAKMRTNTAMMIVVVIVVVIDLKASLNRRPLCCNYWSMTFSKPWPLRRRKVCRADISLS